MSKVKKPYYIFICTNELSWTELNEWMNVSVYLWQRFKKVGKIRILYASKIPDDFLSLFAIRTNIIFYPQSALLKRTSRCCCLSVYTFSIYAPFIFLSFRFTFVCLRIIKRWIVLQVGNTWLTQSNTFKCIGTIPHSYSYRVRIIRVNLSEMLEICQNW